MVAENPLSNGDDRGPSLPPEPPGSPTSTAQLSPTMITVNAQLAELKIRQKILDLAILTLAEKQARNLVAMAKNPNHTLPPESSNQNSVNPTRAELSTPSVETPPPTPPLDIFSKTRENKENTENTSFQYFKDPHGHSSPESRFALAPPSQNTPPSSPPFLYPHSDLLVYRRKWIPGVPMRIHLELFL